MIRPTVLLAMFAAALQPGCTAAPPPGQGAAPDGSQASGPATVATTTAGARPRVERAPFGRTRDGQLVELFTLTNRRGIEIRAATYGGILVSVRTPDRAGAFDDVALGFDSLPAYLGSSSYFGALVGRYANRIGRARFTLDGRTYTLAANNGPNALHGGRRGFDKVVWAAEPFRTDSSVGMVLTHTSPDGHEGYPGTLRTRVTYTLTDRDELAIDYHAVTDKPTPVNLTQHAYWNLAGQGRGDVLGHLLTLRADSLTPVDSTLIPLDRHVPVDGTPFDFRQPTAIGARIDRRDHPQIVTGRGYDHNFVLTRRTPSGLEHAARVVEPTTGRTLDVYTTEPGMQLYTGNFNGVKGKAGRIYARRAAFALETQHYPDSPNRPDFPSTILRPGQEYRSRTVFAFGVAR